MTLFILRIILFLHVTNRVLMWLFIFARKCIEQPTAPMSHQIFDNHFQITFKMCKYFHKIFPYSWATAKILQSDNHSCILLHYINYFSFIWATVKIPPQQSHNHLFFHILYIFCRIQDIWATTTMSHQPTGNYLFFHIVYFLCGIFPYIWATTTTPPQQSDRAKTLRRLLRRLPWTQRPPRGWCRNCKKCKCIIMRNIEHNIAMNWSLTMREAVKKLVFFRNNS